jgi:hypothetical protein
MISEYDLFINDSGIGLPRSNVVSIGEALVTTLNSNAMVIVLSSLVTEFMMEEFKVQRQNRPFVLAFSIYFSNVASFWAIKNGVVQQLF